MLIQHTLTAAEAVIGRLPPDVRILHSLRDYLIVEIQLSPTARQVVLVLFDPDRDLRALWCLGTLVKFDRDACSTLVAVAESRGRLRSWWTASVPMLAAVNIHALKSATDFALAPDDQWRVEAPVYVNTKPDGTADVDALPDGDLLRLAAPRSVALGRAP